MGPRRRRRQEQRQGQQGFRFQGQQGQQGFRFQGQQVARQSEPDAQLQLAHLPSALAAGSGHSSIFLGDEESAMLTRTSDTLGEDLSPIGEPAVLLPHEPEPKVHRRDELWLLGLPTLSRLLEFVTDEVIDGGCADRAALPADWGAAKEYYQE